MKFYKNNYIIVLVLSFGVLKMRYIGMILFFTTLLIASSIKPYIQPIPLYVKFDYQKALLGKKLFFDNKLSIDESISCASCHDLETGGDDGLSVSFGVNGQKGNMNAPTVLNSVFNIAQFWNGRAANLKEQALGPIQNPVEMAHDFKKLIPKLKNTSYDDEFKKIYPQGITKDNIADAIAEFEKTLITPNSRFDNYLRGDTSALSKKEKEGYELFLKKACIMCHNGVNVGGNHFSKFGNLFTIKNNWLGRFEVTKKEQDKYYFKVPSLRNIALTSPYFHDGREPSLKKAVKLMAKAQLGRDIKDEEADKIVAFLKTLTGKLEVIK